MPVTYSVKTSNWETNALVRRLLKYRFSEEKEMIAVISAVGMALAAAAAYATLKLAVAGLQWSLKRP